MYIKAGIFVQCNCVTIDDDISIASHILTEWFVMLEAIR